MATHSFSDGALHLDCPEDLVLVPSEDYKPPCKQYQVRIKPIMHFTVNGRHGVPLNPVESGEAKQLDEPDTVAFDPSTCGPKVTYVNQFPGYPAHKLQKHARGTRAGKLVPNNRAKVLRQVAEVMEAFMSFIAHLKENSLFFGSDGVRLEDLYLLGLRQVAKASFQPILAVKRERLIQCGIIRAYSLSAVADGGREGAAGSRELSQDCQWKSFLDDSGWKAPEDARDYTIGGMEWGAGSSNVFPPLDS